MTVYTTVPLDDSNLDVTVTESNDLVYIDINPAAFATIGVSKEYVDDRDAVTLSSANSYTDTSIAAIPPTDLTSYETIVNSEAGDATTLSSANSYTDTSIAAIPAVDLSSYETIVNSNAGDATTLSSANTYTDTSIAAIPAVDLSSYETIVNSNAGDATTLSSANTYTDTSIAAIPATDLSAYETIVNSNAGDATTLSSANTYTDTSLGAYSTTVQVEALPVSTFTNDAGYLTTETDSQTLSFANPNLTISNGNSVDLSSLTPTVPVTSVNTLTGDVVLTTTEVAEGTNEYFTDAKARTAVSLVTDSSDLTYSSATGVFTYLTPVGAPAPANRVQQDVRNTTGSTILSGSAVYISGASGNKTLIALADADATGQFPAVGVVVSDISNNADGIMVIVGEIQPYDTTNFADNDTLYLSTTAGVLTNTRPGGQGTAVQNIGRVVRGGVSNGIIAVLGSGRANDTPNLSNKNVFIGTATNGVEQRQLDYTTDLLNLPTIPTNNNELTNGAGYATTTYVDTNDATTLASANSYTDSRVLPDRGTGVTSTYVATVVVGGTTFNMPAVTGEIKSDQGYFGISYAGATGITVATLTAASTYVYLDNAGVLQQQVTIPTRQDWSRKIFVMRIAVDPSNNTIIGFEYLNNPLGHYANSIRDVYEYLLAQGIPFKKDQLITGRAADLGFDVSAGTLLEFGGTGDINNANILDFPAVSNAGFFLTTRTAFDAGGNTDLPKFWDNGGTLTALGSTTVVGHRIYRFSNGNLCLQYGQGNYANINLAEAGVLLEDYVLNPILKNATFFGWWLIQETATNTGGTTLTKFVDYTIGVSGGSSSGLSGALLKGNNLSDLVDAATARTNLGIDLANLSDVVTIDPDSSGMTIGATGVTTAKWGSSAPLFWRSDSDDGALKNFVFDNTSQNIFVGMHWKTADSNKKLFRFDATASGGTDPGDGSHTTNFVLSGTNNIFKSRLQNETKTGLEFDANNINLTTTDGVTINSNYTLPNVDGNQDQQLTTDGNGNVSWGDTHSVIDDSGTAPNMTTRNGNTTAFQFISDDQDYNGAYSATLNMISWANLASNNVAFVSYKTTNNNQMLNLKASGSADDGSHQADFTLRGAEGYFSTRDNSSGSGALTDMTFEGTDLTFQASGEIKFEAPRSNVKGLLTISDGVSDYTLPASDGNQDQVMTTNGSGQLAWVASGAVAVTSAPTLTGNADAYKNINYNLTVSNHDNYDNPTYVFGVYDSSGNQVLNNDDFTRISDDTFQFIPPNTSTGTVYDIKVKCQDFGSGQSVTTTKSVTLAVAQARYWRLMNFSGKSIQVGSYPAAVPEIDKGTHDAGTWIDLFALYSQPNQYSVATAGVVMTSNTLPIDKVTSDNYHYSDWEAWKAFDNNNSSNHWGNYGTTALASDYLQIDLGNSWNSSAYAGFSFRIRTKNYANEKVDIAMSSTGAFTGEETIITTVFLKPNYDNNIG